MELWVGGGGANRKPWKLFAVVKQLEWLGNMVQKVAVRSLVRGWASPCNDCKTLPPSSKWVPFSNQGRIRQQKERDGLRLSSAVPKIQ